MVSTRSGVDVAFDALLADIRPTTAERAQASASQQYIRDVLRKAAREGSIPWLLTDADFLSGSYVRHTKIRPLDDVDIVVPLDGTGLYVMRGGMQTSDRVEGSGQTGSPILTSAYDDAAGHKSSIRVLEAFKRVLDAQYNLSTVVRDGQAVNVWLGSYGLGLDIVPAFHIIPLLDPFLDRDYYFIAHGGGRTDWISTNPKRDAQLLDAEAGQPHHNGLLRHVIMFLKYWNREMNNARLKPYHLEVLVWKHFTSVAMTSYKQAVANFLGAAPALIRSSCPDPSGLGADLDEYLADNNRQAAAEAAQFASRWAMLATISEGLDKESDAISAWRHVFGEAFG